LFFVFINSTFAVLKLLTNNILAMKTILSALVVMAAVVMVSCGGNTTKPAQTDSTAVAACPDTCQCDTTAAAAATPQQ